MKVSGQGTGGPCNQVAKELEGAGDGGGVKRVRERAGVDEGRCCCTGRVTPVVMEVLKVGMKAAKTMLTTLYRPVHPNTEGDPGKTR